MGQWDTIKNVLFRAVFIFDLWINTREVLKIYSVRVGIRNWCMTQHCCSFTHIACSFIDRNAFIRPKENKNGESFRDSLRGKNVSDRGMEKHKTVCSETITYSVLYFLYQSLNSEDWDPFRSLLCLRKWTTTLTHRQRFWKRWRAFNDLFTVYFVIVYSHI